MPSPRTALITAYRDLIRDRYDYDKLKNRPDLPSGFSREKVDAFRDYFLTYIYPDPARRAELDAAFVTLDSFVRQPDKLLRILRDSAALVFKFGRHLPKVLASGMNALRSFRAASAFEEKLIENAVALNLPEPYNTQDVNRLIGMLSPAEINDFVDSSVKLFETLHDRKLVKKIIAMIGALLEKMRKKPEVYSPDEIRGLEIGYETIAKGDALFETLTAEEQRELLVLVEQLEREKLAEIFG